MTPRHWLALAALWAVVVYAAWALSTLDWIVLLALASMASIGVVHDANTHTD